MLNGKEKSSETLTDRKTLNEKTLTATETLNKDTETLLERKTFGHVLGKTLNEKETLLKDTKTLPNDKETLLNKKTLDRETLQDRETLLNKKTFSRETLKDEEEESKEKIPNMDKTAPDMDKTAPDMNKTAPDMDKTAPDMNRTTQDVDKTAPDMNRTTPDMDKTAPNGDKTAPDMNRTVPDMDKTAPDGDKTVPDGDKTAPDPTDRAQIPTSLPLVTDKKPNAKNCYRLVVLGASRVGKTSLVARFLNNKFDETYTPTIEDFHRKLYRIRGDIYQLDILDTSGNHPFPAMKRLAFLTGDLFVLVFSWDSRDSWSEVVRLREQIIESKQSVSSIKKKGSRGTLRIPMVIAGNKSDKDSRTVSKDEVKEYLSSKPSCYFIETSAKKNDNVDKLFFELFVLANLPMEMSPALHKRIPIQSTSEPVVRTATGRTGAGRISLRRRLSEAYGVISPNARRPSIRTDLLNLRAKSKVPVPVTGIQPWTSKKSKREVSCVLQ